MPRRANPRASHAYLERVTVPFVLPTHIHAAMLVIWHLRKPLQHRFPLHRGQVRDYVRFLAWCATVGRKEYAILRAIPEWDTQLAQPISLPIIKGDQWSDGFSVAMFLYGVVHCHYTFRAILEGAGVRDLVARSFWRGQGFARHAPSPAAWQKDFLRRKFGTIDRLAAAIFPSRPKEAKAHEERVEKLHWTRFSKALFEDDLPPEDGTSALDNPPVVTAHLPPGLKRSPVRLPFPFLSMAALMEWANLKPSEFQLSTVTRLVPTSPSRNTTINHPFGVNLFGYARGELGIGEDIRLVAHALKTQNIPFCIVNVEPGKEISQDDHSVEHWITDEPRYGINVICLTGVEQARVACEKGLEMFAGRYNIGLSPWELPQWPSSCQYTYGMLDEIWGISSYTSRSFQNAPIPVIPMTLPVMVGAISELNRASFGLPDKPYLFVFAFDLHSSVARKNPEGVIRAFERAFPTESADEVGLVVKVNTSVEATESLTILERLASYASKHRPWHVVKRAALQNPRIHFIERSLRRPQVMALYRACDCFISLHRAEGFGRSMAEALLLDRQVIATGYSGNMDFCAEPRVGLVRYHLRPLRSDEYFWSQGQMWAEPDIDHAAELMRDIRQHPRKTYDPNFNVSPTSVGRRYALRLWEIQKKFNLPVEESFSENAKSAVR